MSRRLKMSFVQAFPRPGRCQAAAPDPTGHPSSDGAAGGRHGPYEVEVNVVMIKGVITEEPTPDTSRGGEPVMLLTLGFAAADAKDENERWASTSCTVEVSSQLAATFDGELQKGATVLVVGQLAGGGDVLARGLCLGSTPAETEFSFSRSGAARG
jgi:primosomal replication protein N